MNLIKPTAFQCWMRGHLVSVHGWEGEDGLQVEALIMKENGAEMDLASLNETEHACLQDSWRTAGPFGLYEHSVWLWEQDTDLGMGATEDVIEDA